MVSCVQLLGYAQKTLHGELSLHCVLSLKYVVQINQMKGGGKLESDVGIIGGSRKNTAVPHSYTIV